MISLILAILLGTVIFFIFKGFAIYQVKTIPAIIVNYVVCGLTGGFFLVLNDYQMPNLTEVKAIFPYALGMGFIFVTTFCSMAFTSQKLGVAVASITAKMSLVIPVLLALFVFKYNEVPFNWMNYTGILVTFPAIILATWVAQSNDKQGKKSRSVSGMILLLIVFVGSGIIDAGLNYINRFVIEAKDIGFFSILIFMCAFVFGSSFILYKGIRPGKKEVLWGLILGIPNYFAIYFLVAALGEFNNNGALVYPIVNISTIVLSAIGGVIAFKEKKTMLNYVGLVMSIIAIILLQL